MAVDVRIPELGESVSEAVIANWIKQDGEYVKSGEAIVEIETEKAAMEITAEGSGRLEIVEPAGARVGVGTVVARIVEADEAPAPEPSTAPPSAAPGATEPPRRDPGRVGEAAAPTVPVAPPSTAATGPSSSRALTEALPRPQSAEAPRRATTPAAAATDGERVPMTELRRTIAARLVEAQRTAAILTTFNEVDVKELLALRGRHRERFRSKHGVDLGLMSLFARATVLALGDTPILNARIDGTDVLYHRRVHLGIAVATPRGLVVPVVRHADAMTLADLERAIGDLARRARETKLAPDDLAGGTFSITNGGVFGSLLSTPLLNPPQSGILGMHRIQDRPVAIDGQVVIRPMMYVALSYDHRLVDGEQAVTFLVRIKEQLEDPARMVLDV